MNIFFGKISTKIEREQITKGYYKAPKGSSWFGDIKIGDYTYIVGGDKIQLWKAKKWGTHNEKECLWFEILNNNIGIKTNKFTALKLFKLTTDLIIHTSRSAKNRAFFKLEQRKKLDLSDIADTAYYKNENLYRKTIFNQDSTSIEPTSEDLNFCFEKGKLKLVENTFTDKNVVENFRDNLSYTGKGSKRKDKLLKEILQAKKDSTTLKFNPNQHSLRTVYDTFFCEYKAKEKYYLTGAFWQGSNPKDQTQRFLNDGIWENGYDEKFTDIVLDIPEQSNIAIKTVTRQEDTMRIKAMGTVIKNNNDGKIVEVEWEDNFEEFTVNFSGGYWATITEVTHKDHINAIWNHTNSNNTTQEKKKEKETHTPMPALNRIFYGPPGTGKTYNTILEAAKITTGNTNIEYDKALNIFNENLGDQIEFITFHQNYSYEDFIQGLRPETGTEGNLSFYKKDGVFKALANKALKNYKASKNPLTTKKEFDNVFNELIQPLNEEETTELEIQMKRISFHITEVGEKSIEFRKNQGESKHTLSISTLKKMYEKEKNDIILGGLQPYYNPILKILLEKGKNNIQPEPLKNYVIIIDEINRANISRVFGELITLIEKDKRYGGKIPLTATLPSGEQLTIPPNLYIIGTMNTADKSIALLDIALRRRFQFVPMYPIYQLNNTPIPYAEQLKKINQEIINRKGHDFTIGHAYFMEEDNTIENIMNTKVIPLLLEYFMNDEKEVQTLLQTAGIEVKNEWPMQYSKHD